MVTEEAIAVAVVVGPTEVAAEVDILEDSLGVQFPAGFPVTVPPPAGFLDVVGFPPLGIPDTVRLPVGFPLRGDFPVDLLRPTKD